MDWFYEIVQNNVDMLDKLVENLCKLQEQAHNSMSRIDSCVCDEDAERYSFQVAENIGEAAYNCKAFWGAVCEMCAYVGVDKEGEA